MKIQPIDGVSKSYFCKKSFKGSPVRVNSIPVRNWQDALKNWEFLRYAKYLDAHNNSYYDKTIRADNYAFLDKLTNYGDKANFVEKYCNFTGFPNLIESTRKINDVFRDCIYAISNKLNSQYFRGQYDIIDYGYDPTCSVGLKKAFPGSDLDKGYVILKGGAAKSLKEDSQIVNNFKGELWNNLDQRIVSLNHQNNDISVYTITQIEKILNSLDPIADSVIFNKIFKRGKDIAFGIAMSTTIVGALLFGGYTINRILEMNRKDEKLLTSTDPYEAALFNRKMAQNITNEDLRRDAKNFAFFIETVREKQKLNPHNQYHSIFSKINNSPFVKNSNVTQIGAWLSKINGGYLKTKLKNREGLQRDFNYMTTETKYDLVKDIIKYGTDEQSNKFEKYFKNDDNIANRYDSLLISLE